MFTGLIESKGTVQKITSRGDYKVLVISSTIDTDQIVMGESIACDGACLTVVHIERDSFGVEASTETQTRTKAEQYVRGTVINLERAVRMGDRLGGHLVTGHIDDVGRVEHVRSAGRSIELAVTFDRKYDPLVIEKGSIAIDGVSLTVNTAQPGRLSVNLIPHTIGATTLEELRTGDRVNLEF
ncbi:MAG: riboflavin synthase, partial [candidate division Zixibacteria bacterium]|nr:riboflavin synthase [candidate division Zixibacteria bacterium]